MEYLDLDLRIGARSEGAHRVSAESPLIGGGDSRMRPLRLDSNLQALRIALLESDTTRGIRRGIPTAIEKPARDLGTKLFNALFTGDVKAVYDTARDRARDKDGLRLRLGIDDPALMTVPWEFLFDPAQEEYLCLMRGVTFVRYLRVLTPPTPLAVSLPLTVVGLIASPIDAELGVLDVEHEKSQVEAALRPLIDRGFVTLKWTDGSTVDDLETALRADRCNVLHFIGHGYFESNRDEGGIVLADRNGRPHMLGASKLGQVLAGRRQLRLVVLNACEGARGSSRGVFSSTASTLVRRGIPAVVAMQFQINDSAASQFADKFYEHMADGAAVDAAVTEARIAMNVGSASTIEWGSPVLYMQSPTGVLFDVGRVVDPTPSPSPSLSPSLAPRSGVSTLVVDQLHRGDYASIGEAIAAARSGDRILVRPGFYSEGLVIDKPLEIVGESTAADVIVQAEGMNAVLFKTTTGRVANLKLTQSGVVERLYCVDITQGRLELEDCDIRGDTSACVAVHGAADPRLRRNQIHGSKQCGVLVFDDGQGVLEDNVIFGNGFAGVAIKSGANPTLRGNTIREGRASGVYVHDGGQGVVEDNDVSGHARSGVVIGRGGNPTLRNNRIHDNMQSGVLVHNGGRGRLEGNDIFGNTFAGLSIRTLANPTVQRSRIHDGKADGVYVEDDGAGLLEDNEIEGNARAGVRIASRADPVVRRNRIGGGNRRGVYIHDAGRGTLEDNDIAGNDSVGVEIRTGANPTLRANRISSVASVGVVIARDAVGLLEDNDISGNTSSGVEIRTGANPTVRNNRIGAGNGRGVYVHDDGRGIVEDNDIFDSQSVGVEIRAGASPTLRRNRIRGGATVGVVVARNGLGLLEDNDVSDNKLAGVEIRTAATATLRRNRINRNGGVAVWIHDEGGGTITDNDLRTNTDGAWTIAPECEPKVTRTRNLE